MIIHEWDFRFVRWFLYIVLLLGVLLLGLVGVMGWHLGMVVSVEGKGRIEPHRRYFVKPLQAGIIKQIHVQQGDVIQPGDLLVSLDDTELLEEQRRLQAEIALNAAQVQALKVTIHGEQEIRLAEFTRAQQAYAQAQLQLERAKAEQQVQTGGLFGQRSIDDLWPVRIKGALLAEQEAVLGVSAKRVAATKHRSQELLGFKKEQERLVQALDITEARLERTRLRAREAGTVISAQLQYKVGDFVNRGEVVMEIADLNAWKAAVGVHETDLPQVQLGQPVRLYIAAYPHMEYEVFEGTVDRVPSGPGVRLVEGFEYYVSVAIEDPKSTHQRDPYLLTHGMNVDAKIEVEKGRILGLIWRYLLRTTGGITRNDFYWHRGDRQASTERSGHA